MVNKRYKLEIPKEGIYQLEAGIYSVETAAEALAAEEDVEIVEGAGEHKAGKLSLDEKAKVWIPPGSTLSYWGEKETLGVPFKLTISPLEGTGETKFTCTISGAKSDRKVQIKLDKALALNPVAAELIGDGTVYLTGDEIAARMEGILEKRIPTIRAKTKRIGIYGVEKSWWIDRKTPMVDVKVTYGGVVEKVEEKAEEVIKKILPGVAPPTPVTPEEAAKAVAEGRPLYIKCTLPLISLLPSPIPYRPGIPILPGFAISATP